ncbi:MAG: metal-sensitive transcriptional regulator [bacterium]|nr:metal-sensitive transcriptional regulator [bacterium]
MFQPKNPKERILHRLKIARGHLEKVISMVEKDEYCIDILHQSTAVQKALSETDFVILENHLKTCAADAIKQGKQEEAIKEIMEVIKKTRKS